MSVLKELQSAVVRAAEKVGPSVVGLGRGWGRGSGVITADGTVLTNAHVLRGEEVAVTFADGRTEHGRVAGADPDLDLAAIAVETGDAEPVAWEPERVDAVAAKRGGSAAAETVGPSVVGLGRGWGRGSGVITAAGTVLTNAHVLRGEEVAVTFADGRTEHGRVAGADADLDLAAIAVETGDARAGRVGARARRRGRDRRARVRARQPRRARAAHHLRPRLGDRALVPRPSRAAHRRLDRAHRAAAARLLGRPAGRRRGPAARPQLDPGRRRPDPRAARRRRDAAPRRGARRRQRREPAAARDRDRAAARRAAHARRGRPARARRSARARGRGGQPRRRAPGWSAATCWSAPPGAR